MLRKQINVLFFSSMPVSPFSGGGNTVYNLLEPPPDNCEIYYAAEGENHKSKPVFDEILERTFLFNYPQPTNAIIPEKLQHIGIFKKLGSKIFKWEVKQRRRRIIRDTLDLIANNKIGLLLICPQGGLLHESVEIIKATNLPTISWFMDDYFTAGFRRRLGSEIWQLSKFRYVISEAMRKRFVERFGLDAEVLNNSVDFPASMPSPPKEKERGLKVVYAGRLHSYYAETMTYVISEIQKLNGTVQLFIYSADVLHGEGLSSDFIHFLPPVKADQLNSCLQQGDIVLLLSSFSHEYKDISDWSRLLRKRKLHSCKQHRSNNNLKLSRGIVHLVGASNNKP